MIHISRSAAAISRSMNARGSGRLQGVQPRAIGVDDGLRLRFDPRHATRSSSAASAATHRREWPSAHPAHRAGSRAPPALAPPPASGCFFVPRRGLVVIRVTRQPAKRRLFRVVASLPEMRFEIVFLELVVEQSPVVLQLGDSDAAPVGGGGASSAESSQSSASVGSASR
jgi:hypothetical protein